MRTLITGGAGFLGLHIAEHLLEAGGEVLMLDNFATANRELVPDRDRQEVVEGSVADAKLVDELFDRFRPEVVVHSAASYKDPEAWVADVETNILGTIHVVRAAQRRPCRRFIYLQTALGYGKPQRRPIDRSHPREPFTSYSISKTAGERYVELSELPWVSLRLANIYGPRHYSGPMPTFYKRLKAGQECFIVDTRRDFLEIADFLRLIDRILATDHVGAFNVSTGQDNSIKEIFDMMAALMDIELARPPEIKPHGGDDVASLLLDPSETEQTFGWKAEVPLQAGLQRLIRSYERDGVGETYTHLQLKKAG